MGVWAVRFYRTFIPFFLTLITLFLITFVMISGLKRDTLLDKNYLFKIDARNIYAHQAPVREEGLTLAETIGLQNNYYFYFFNHCSSRRGLTKLKCTDPRIDYHFDGPAILKKNLFYGSTVKLPRGTNSFTQKVRISSLCMVILYLSGLLFSLLTLVTVVVISISGTGVLFASVIAGYAAFAFLGGSGTMTLMYFFVKKTIRDKAKYLRLKTSQGTLAILYLWIATLISFIAFTSLLLATRLDRKKKIVEEAKLYQ